MNMVERRTQAPLLWAKIPILHEDEENEDEMGEADIHTRTVEILAGGVEIHVEEIRPDLKLRIFSDLNLYYQGESEEGVPEKGCTVPDVMAVPRKKPLPRTIKSYTIGKEGPRPRLVIEVLSVKTSQTDLKDKPVIYAALEVEEYVLVDPTGEYLPEQLVLKRLQPDGTWKEYRDADGGVTSQLGFRIIVEEDGWVRVVNAETGEKYPRPREAWKLAQETKEAEQARQQAEYARQQAEQARVEAEQRAQELEAELKCLRKQRSKD
jgi:Uma2 family endonuclease